MPLCQNCRRNGESAHVRFGTHAPSPQIEPISQTSSFCNWAGPPRAKRSTPTLSARVESLLESLEVLPLDRETNRHYAEIRLHLDRTGRPIGPNDLLIAAHALALDLTLVSDNVEEFARIPRLTLENWLAS